jgi:hypothetical protein
MTILFKYDQQGHKNHKKYKNEILGKTGATPNIFRGVIFDTKNYYFYFTEVWKDKC